MTTKTISGYYKNGYTLSASYSGLNITSAAYVIGSGVVATANASIFIHERVDASSDDGFDGIHFEAGGYLYNGACLQQHGRPDVGGKAVHDRQPWLHRRQI